MSEILHAFGIDWRLLVIYSVNFALLLGVLWYFLYGPLTKIIEERRRLVAKGVEDAEAAAIKLSEIESSRSAILADAGKEADEVLMKAREAAEIKRRELIAAGEANAARILGDAELAAREAKERSLEESKKELAKLVVLGVEKTMAGKS
jgi:F-type H+-transporting ATPase subunit b